MDQNIDRDRLPTANGESDKNAAGRDHVVSQQSGQGLPQLRENGAILLVTFKKLKVTHTIVHWQASTTFQVFCNTYIRALCDGAVMSRNNCGYTVIDLASTYKKEVQPVRRTESLVVLTRTVRPTFEHSRTQRECKIDLYLEAPDHTPHSIVGGWEGFERRYQPNENEKRSSVAIRAWASW